MVAAMQWVSQITTVSLEMSLPAGLGYWLDKQWGAEPWLVIVGAVLGFYVAMTHLMQLVAAEGRAAGNRAAQSKKQRSDKSDDSL